MPFHRFKWNRSLMAHAPLDIETVIGRIMRRNIERALAVGCVIFGGLLVLADGVFAAPHYQLLALLISQKLFGMVLFALGTVRTVVLIVNGYWPVGPYVRLALSMATLLLGWLPFSLSLAWFAFEFLLKDGPGAILPGVILAPLVAWAEAMCAVALVAWIEAIRGPNECNSTRPT